MPNLRTALRLAVVVVFASLFAFAQEAVNPEPLQGVDVHADRTVTFHCKAPNAKLVEVGREGAKNAAMQPDGNGWWSLTTAPLAADLYTYSFVVDGVVQFDPLNPIATTPNFIYVSSLFLVPGGQPWEVADVPHGRLTHHYFKSTIVGDQRQFIVYTPAGYEENKMKNLPVLYLLHGFSDDATGWTAVGKANVILDNLIAAGKAKPMIVVMTFGYGDTQILKRGGNMWDNKEIRERNFSRYTDVLLSEVIPQVETNYRVSTKRTDRAISGLSMGGSETLLTGLNHLDKFAWVGSYSAGGLGTDFDSRFPKLEGAEVNKNLRLLYIACGVDDRLIKPNRELIEWLKTKGVKVTAVETEGEHQWQVWRKNLAEFAGKLFKN